MKKVVLLYFILFAFLFSNTSCYGNDDYETILDTIVVNNNTNNLSTKYNIRKVGTYTVNSLTYKGINRSAQGMAINGNVMFRLYNTGVCQTFDISDIDNPIPLHVFELGSFWHKNHCNSAQFIKKSLFEQAPSLLYVSGLFGKCFVEEVTDSTSKLVQTITLNKLTIFNDFNHVNIICGDDNYLWFMGGSTTTLHFGKLRKPDITEKDVILTEEDVLDFWSESDYIYSESVWQGGKVYNGLLYFVFGSNSSHSHIAIYDTATHLKVEDIELDSYVKEEPEDCDIVDGNIILTINGGKGYYIISPVE